MNWYEQSELSYFYPRFVLSYYIKCGILKYTKGGIVGGLGTSQILCSEICADQ